jgi:hypothetical protein
VSAGSARRNFFFFFFLRREIADRSRFCLADRTHRSADDGFAARRALLVRAETAGWLGSRKGQTALALAEGPGRVTPGTQMTVSPVVGTAVGIGIQAPEVRTLDCLKTNYCESICQGCFH